MIIGDNRKTQKYEPLTWERHMNNVAVLNWFD